MKRPFDIVFLDPSNDASLSPVSWRTGLHSDLLLHVGLTSYHVHKVIVGHGERASRFVNSVFGTAVGQLTNQMPSRMEIDLTKVLPEALWDVFETVLDFMYTGELHSNVSYVLKLLACSELLQIKALFHRCREDLGPLLIFENIPFLLADSSMPFLSEAVRERIKIAASGCIIEGFLNCSVEYLQAVPTCELANIFASSRLVVTHEDFLFDLIKELVVERGAAAEVLWASCRMWEVSSDRLKWAREQQGIPAHSVWSALDLYGQSWCRQSFVGISCAVIFDRSNSSTCYDMNNRWYNELQDCIRSRGGDVEVFHDKAWNSSMYHGFSVIITDLPRDSLRHIDNLQKLLDGGGGLILLREIEFNEFPESGEDWFLDPLAIAKGDVQFQCASMFRAHNVRKGKALEKSTDILSCQLAAGVDVERWRTRALYWTYPFNMDVNIDYNRRAPYQFRILPNAKVLIELEMNGIAIPLVVLHPTQQVAVFWDNAAWNEDWELKDSNGKTMPQLQLLLNTVLVFARRRCSGP